jgi:HNH endonuclease
MKTPIKILPFAMHPATVQRFWSKVKQAAPDDCWEWQASISKNGYGSFKLGVSAVTTSRMAYALSTNDDPGEMVVCHTCDNRKCCNPSHLYKGTISQNSRDMVERGRWRGPSQLGSNNATAKLVEADILTIRGQIATGRTNVAIAKDFGVSHQMISKIRRGHFWKHVVGVQGEAA